MSAAESVLPTESLIVTEDLKQLLLTNRCSLETTECCLLLAKNKILCSLCQKHFEQLTSPWGQVRSHNAGFM